MGLIKLIQEVPDKRNAIEFLQNKGILHKRRLCRIGHEMHMQLLEKNDRWVCQKRSCRQYIALKKGTFLEYSKLSYEIFVYFVYSWTVEYTTTKFCAEEFGMAGHTITDWKNFLREVCADSVIKNPSVIGGEGLTVEIDESLFSKRKYNVGKTYPEQWVFGGICRETRECFMYAVPDRSTETLINVVKECIHPGSIIISDCWKSYNGISKLSGYDFRHLTVNHSKNFRDPITGVHTNTVEGMWALAKKRNKVECGTRRTLLDSCLCEFIWRNRNKDKDLFEEILKDISAFMPPK